MTTSFGCELVLSLTGVGIAPLTAGDITSTGFAAVTPTPISALAAEELTRALNAKMTESKHRRQKAEAGIEASGIGWEFNLDSDSSLYFI